MRKGHSHGDVRGHCGSSARQPVSRMQRPPAVPSWFRTHFREAFLADGAQPRRAVPTDLRPDATQFKVSNGAGTFPSIPSGKSANAVLTGTSIRDTDMQSTFCIARHTLIGPLLRRLGPWAGRRIAVSWPGEHRCGRQGDSEFQPDEGVGRDISRFGGPAVHWSPPTRKITIRLQAVGTTSVGLKVKAWICGGPNQAGKLSADDTSASRITAAGAVGLWAYVSSGGAASTDNVFSVSANDVAGIATPPAPAPAPAPAPVRRTLTSTGCGGEPGRGRCIRGGQYAICHPLGCCVRGDERFRRCEWLVQRSAAQRLRPPSARPLRDRRSW